MSEMNRKAMYKLTYGLFVCTVPVSAGAAATGATANGCITNTAVQVASDPNLISIALNKSSFTHDCLKETGICNISVLSEKASFDTFQHFGFQSGRDVDKFADSYDAENYSLADNGVPYITAGTNAYFSLHVKEMIDLGSHTLFLCEPTAMEVLSEIPSCTYDYYQKNIKPAPEPVGKTEGGETIWRCTICGYIYVGEELPDDFICPLCGHPKEDFVKETR
jgi:flavin reductase (DIM6/NTAB) family NADH-FMN oxidoreductase RutF